MNRAQLFDLYRKLAENRLNTLELELLTQYFNQDDQEEWSRLIQAELQFEQQALMATPAERLILKRVYHNIEEQVLTEKTPILPLYKRFSFRIGIAAALVFMIAGLAFYTFRNNPGPEEISIANAASIIPAQPSATLTLANGRKIVLSAAAQGRLGKEAGVEISKTADGALIYQIKDQPGNTVDQENTLSTAKGEHYRVILPDGSKVWLNAASSITYPVSFAAKPYRKVKLSGEAYFEVAKDKAHAFFVKTTKQEIKVLGTHFNVSAYHDEPETKTTLLEGSVQVSRLVKNTVNKLNKEELILVPGQQSILTDQSFNTQNTNAEEAVAWKNGYFRFNKEHITDIMQKLARWYNLEIVYEGEVSAEEFSGTASNTKTAAQVLNMLQYSQSVHFKVEGRRITVTK